MFITFIHDQIVLSCVQFVVVVRKFDYRFQMLISRDYLSSRFTYGVIKHFTYKLINNVEIVFEDGIFSTINRVSKWQTARGSYARLITALKAHDRSLISLAPTVEAYKAADQLMYLMSMPYTRQLEYDNKLTSFSVFWVDGIAYLTGRLGIAGMEFLGTDKLVVLSPKTRLAYLIMKQAHYEDHRMTPGEVLSRSRKYAYIVSGTNLAKFVAKDCQLCKTRQRVLTEQKMSQLPPQMFQVPTAPFTNVTLDFMHPIMVKAINNKRSKLKCFPLVIVCMNTGSLHTMVCTGYSTQDFLLQWESFCALRGQAAFVYSDPGSQLVAAKHTITADNTNDLVKNMDWKHVMAQTARAGTTWKICPAESQWRDGRSERMIQCLSKTLKHLHNGGEVNYAELQVLLNRACNVINQRPLGLKHHNGQTPGFSPVTPNTLLQGFRTQDPVEDPERFDQAPDKFVMRLKMMEQYFNTWWKHWYSQVFDSLIPYRRWKESKPNLEVGDICLLMYKGKLVPALYRMCRIIETYPDDLGDVRTVRVEARPRDSRDPTLPYVSKDLVEMTVSVQRLVLLLPKSEQDAIRPEPNVGDNIVASVEYTDANDSKVWRCQGYAVHHGFYYSTAT